MVHRGPGNLMGGGLLVLVRVIWDEACDSWSHSYQEKADTTKKPNN